MIWNRGLIVHELLKGELYKSKVNPIGINFNWMYILPTLMLQLLFPFVVEHFFIISSILVISVSKAFISKIYKKLRKQFLRVRLDKN